MLSDKQEAPERIVKVTSNLKLKLTLYSPEKKDASVLNPQTKYRFKISENNNIRGYCDP